MKSKNKLFRGNESEALHSLKDFLSSKFELLDFRVFGSKVRNEDNLESDIDVMIVLGNSNPEIESQVDDIIFEINLKNDCFISAVIFSREELEKGPLDESPIYKVIKKEGVSI